jgi:hypothetical protein
MINVRTKITSEKFDVMIKTGINFEPAVGRVLAQQALGLPTDVSLLPYSLERFRTGRLLTGRYGMGAVA